MNAETLISKRQTNSTLCAPLPVVTVAQAFPLLHRLREQDVMLQEVSQASEPEAGQRALKRFAPFYRRRCAQCGHGVLSTTDLFRTSSLTVCRCHVNASRERVRDCALMRVPGCSGGRYIVGRAGCWRCTLTTRNRCELVVPTCQRGAEKVIASQRSRAIRGCVVPRMYALCHPCGLLDAFGSYAAALDAYQTFEHIA